MSYVLGTATVTNAPPRLQNTVQGDSLLSLAAAYGVTPQQIWDLQRTGKPMERVPVQNFVKALPGWSRANGIFPFFANTAAKPKNNPGTVGPDGKPEGFAFFTSTTQIMLPNMPRLDGKGPHDTVPPDPSVPGSAKKGLSPMLIVLGVGALALLFLGGSKKKPASKSSPKPVAMR